MQNLRDNVAFLKLQNGYKCNIYRPNWHWQSVYRQELTKAMLGAKPDISYNPFKENQVY